MLGQTGIKRGQQDSNYSMGIRPILVLTTACAALFGISFAVGGVFKKDDGRAPAPSVRSAFPVTIDESRLALGRAAGLPDLRRPPRPAEPGDAPAPVAQSQASAAAPAPGPEPSIAPPPSSEPTAPPPASPTPVEQQTPVTPSPPQSSTPDNTSSRPAPDAAPSQPSPSPDPYASGGSQFYDDGG